MNLFINGKYELANSQERSRATGASFFRPLSEADKKERWDSGPLPSQMKFFERGAKKMKRREVESLTLPGMAKRSMPPGKIEINMIENFEETPLFKAALRAEIEDRQMNLFEKGGEVE